MKLLHTADLHIGKKLFEKSLIEEQRHMLRQITDIAGEEQVDAVLIAGDVYDRAVPSTEAVALLDDFLTNLLAKQIAVFLISGNHDSPERVAFADRILEKQGLYIAGTYSEEVKTITLQDAFGSVEFVCVPFVKPAVAGCSTTKETVEKMLKRAASCQRRVLLTHYFVTGEQGESPELSDSESDVNVGGLDSIPASLFADFSYTALGHIHKSQKIGQGNVYYSGAPLKYSFGEAGGEKSVNIVELGAQGETAVTKRVLKPLHEMRCIKGRLSDLTGREALEALEAGGISREDYLQVTLTDSEELLNPMATLRSVYPNVLLILLQKNLEQEHLEYESRLTGVKKNTAELFADFYEMLKGEPLDEKKRSLVEEAAGKAQEESQ